MGTARSYAGCAAEPAKGKREKGRARIALGLASSLAAFVAVRARWKTSFEKPSSNPPSGRGGFYSVFSVDAVVAQGYEAGGHRGTFLGFEASALIGTIAPVPQFVDKVSVPVIASGGIMDGRGIVAALALGASAVQMGTAFLASRESGAHPSHKKAVLQSRDTSTVITAAFSGKPARGIQNAFISLMREYEAPIPPYPVQNALTRPMRDWAARQPDPEFMALWAGQGSAMCREAGAGEIVRRLIREAEQVLGALSR
ncbi:NAD(P)H-dependent flavin oxidoreductase [Hydrogenibacillus schlegelii]|uniref:NAD(P)H-dependent flavin oxidoreductase n=1 Tax=Hydrogenibacillus schlegelii TaxID=1484 RepID=UPI0009EA19C0|nr:nitronate monooxygenase family protein [Hydrogenibacillus schlegelii]